MVRSSSRENLSTGMRKSGSRENLGDRGSKRTCGDAISATSAAPKVRGDARTAEQDRDLTNKHPLSPGQALEILERLSEGLPGRNGVVMTTSSTREPQDLGKRHVE